MSWWATGTLISPILQERTGFGPNHHKNATTMAGYQIAPPRGLQAALSSFAAPSTGNRNKSKPSNIRVVVRIRPLNSEEKEQGYRTSIHPCLPRDENVDAASDQTDEDVPNEVAGSSSSPTAKLPVSSKRSFLARFSPARKSRTTNLSTGIFRDKIATFGTPAVKTSTSSADNAYSVTPLIRNTKRPIIDDSVEDPSSKEMHVMPETNEVTNLLADGRQFEFDAVFSPNATQEEVYDRSVSDAVRRNISRGYNTTIIAYGQTGGGKTFTMGGRRQLETMNGAENHGFGGDLNEYDSSHRVAADDGVILRAINDLFKAKQRHESAGEVVIDLSYLEIWNDELRDLLSDDDTGALIKLRDHGEGGVQVKGLTSIAVQSVAQVLELMDKAARRRTTGTTFVNTRSSRSHAICTLTVTIYPALRGTVGDIPASSEVITAKLTLVDLAGSEWIKDTRVTGEQQKESININKDLFVLGKVLSALADNQSQRQKEHVPYRDSKLTRLLRDSLGGNCCTVIIACVSPASCHIDESMNTLRYAERSRCITNDIRPNIAKAILTPAESAAIRAENKLLRGRLAEIKRRYESMQHRNLTLACANEDALDRELTVFERNFDTLANSKNIDRQLLESASSLEEVEVVGLQRKEIEDLKKEIDRLKSSKVDDDSDHETTTVSSLLSFDWSSADHLEGDRRLSAEGECQILSTGESRSIGDFYGRSDADEISSPLTAKKVESFALKMESKSLHTQNKDLAEHLELQRRELASLTSLIDKQRKFLEQGPSLADEWKAELNSDDGFQKDIIAKVPSQNFSFVVKEAPTKSHKSISLFLGLRHAKAADEDSVEMKEFKNISAVNDRQHQVLQVRSEYQAEEISRLRSQNEIRLFEKRQLQAKVSSLKARVSELEKQLEDSGSQRLHIETRLQEEQKLRVECETKLESSYNHFAIVVHERDALLEKHASLEEGIQDLKTSLSDKKEEVVRLLAELRAQQDGQYLEEKENRATPTSAATTPKNVLSTKSENTTPRGSRSVAFVDSNKLALVAYSSPDHTLTQPIAVNAIVPYEPDEHGNTTDDGSSSLETDARQIRLHAAKMLMWAERAIEKSRYTTTSICSSFGSSQGTELRPNLVELKPVPIPRTVTALTASGKPPMLPQRSSMAQDESGRQLVISNLDQVNKCQCQTSMFSGNAEHAEFYLPKLGMACNCGRDKEEAHTPLNDDPCSLENILRPWQVDFLESMKIRDALGYVHAYNQRSALLAKEMRKWRRAQKLTSVKTKSCAVALHIWCRTCKAVVRSVRAQTSKGMKPTRPSFLDLSSLDDNRTVSTLGCGSIYQLTDIDVGSQMEL